VRLVCDMCAGAWLCACLAVCLLLCRLCRSRLTSNPSTRPRALLLHLQCYSLFFGVVCALQAVLQLADKEPKHQAPCLAVAQLVLFADLLAALWLTFMLAGCAAAG
jgi:hypothetical protein